MIELLYFVVGAIAYRARGGGFAGEEIKYLGRELSTTKRRLIWSLAIAILIGTHNLAMGLISFPLIFAGTWLGYLGAEFDLSKPENRNPKNYFFLTMRGLIICLPAAIGLSTFTGMQTGFGGVLAGALFVPCYRLWALSDNKFGNLGELLLGGFITVGLMETL